MLDFRLYRRHFQRPLVTTHGSWAIREGILLRWQPEGGPVRWGEIAPLPWFGSETLAEALAFCRSAQALPALPNVPDHLPASQFGFASLRDDPLPAAPVPESFCAGLLPTGEEALDVWPSLYQQGYRTFKWKIGQTAPPIEMAWCEQLVAALPTTVKLRLDANGGLNWTTAQQWLTFCDRLPASTIEFLEQPLAPAQLPEMLALQQQFTTPLALDESIATLPQLLQCHREGWLGVYVVKPAIAGAPQKLRQLCQQYSLDIVCSTVFETGIGRRIGLQLAQELSHRAAGYGTQHWFNDHWEQLQDGAQLWQQL